MADFGGWEESPEIKGDFLFLLPSASGSRSTKTALPFPLSRDSVVGMVEGPATLPAGMAGEGRFTGIGPVDGGAAVGRSKVWSPKAFQARALWYQACLRMRGSSYPMECQSGQTLGTMFRMRRSSLEHERMRPGMGAAPGPCTLATSDYLHVREEKHQQLNTYHQCSNLFSQSRVAGTRGNLPGSADDGHDLGSRCLEISQRVVNCSGHDEWVERFKDLEIRLKSVIRKMKFQNKQDI